MNKMICFDMDGTIADLYGVPHWLERIRNEDASPYTEAKPLCDMDALREMLIKLNNQGWEIRVISWLSKDSTEEFKKKVRQAKLAWLQYYQFPFRIAHLVQYGTTKANCVRPVADAAILIDDNEKVRNGWSLGETIDPATQDIIAELKKLLV